MTGTGEWVSHGADNTKTSGLTPWKTEEYIMEASIWSVLYLSNLGQTGLDSCFPAPESAMARMVSMGVFHLEPQKCVATSLG